MSAVNQIDTRSRNLGFLSPEVVTRWCEICLFGVKWCELSFRATMSYPRFTHHDFRHFFATTCIESGVDIPTISRWLGHKDGGALAMRVYGHLRQEHSAAAAQKVLF